MGACVRVQAEIDARRACRTDDLCPCGTHCDLGECVATCGNDGDCGGGEVCDDFGRCRADAPGGRIAPIDVSPRGRMVVSPLSLSFVVPDAPRTVHIRPASVGQGRARVLARGPVAVRCAPDADWTTECRFENLPAGGLDVQLQMRAVGGAAGVDSPALVVFGGSGDSHTVVVQPTANADLPTAGVYAGTLNLGGLLPVPVDVRVYDVGLGTLFEIVDRHGLALSAPLVIDATQPAPPLLFGAAPAFRLFEGLTPEGLVTEVLSAAGAPFFADLSGGHLELDLSIPVVGLAVQNPSGELLLRIDALRRGPLPAAFVTPELTPDVADTQDPTRGATPSPVFEAAQAIADAGNPMLYPRDDVAPFVGSPASPTFAACFASPAERAIVEQTYRILRERSQGTAVVAAQVGQMVNAGCVDGCDPADLDSNYYATCEWTRTDQIQVGTGCGQCRDACLTEVRSDCGPNNSSCSVWQQGQFTCDGGCSHDAPVFFDWCPLQLTNSDLSCGDHCSTMCTGLRENNNIVVQKVTTACDAQCARANCTPQPVYVDQDVTVGDCAALAAEYGCEVDDFLTGTWTANGRDYRPTGVCRFGPLRRPSPTTCTENASCFDPDAPNADPGAEFAGPLSARSGAPTCSNGLEPQFGAAEDDGADLALLLDACLEDTARAADGPTLDALVGTAGCLDRGRFLLTYERGMQGTVGGAGDPGAQRIALHALKGFLQALGLLAREGLNQYRESLALARDADPTAAASTQARLLDELLKRAWFEGNQARIDARLATAARFMRAARLAGHLAHDVYEATSATPRTWDNAWNSIETNYRADMERLLNRIEQVTSGKNPLGIEDDDLPLYYRDTPVGPNERFSAVSRYLTGESVDGDGLAAVAIRSARAALDDTQNRWRERLQVLDVADRRIQDIKYRYGEIVTIHCGASLENATNYAGPGQAPCLNPGSIEVMECDAINTEVCFVEDACRGRPETFLEQLSSADLNMSLCVYDGLRQTLGANVIGITPALEQAMTTVSGSLRTSRSAGTAFAPRIVSLTQRAANDRVALMELDGARFEVPLDALGGLDVKIPPSAVTPTPGDDGVDAEISPVQRHWTELNEACGTARDASLALRPAARPADCRAADECPANEVCSAGHCAPKAATDGQDTVDCYYDGAITEQAIAIRSAALDIELARAELDAVVDRYDLTKQSCIILQAGNDALDEQLAAHNETMDDLDRSRAIAADVAALASAGKDCANSFNVDKLITGAVVGVCAFAAVEGAANVAANEYELQMSEAERSHEAEVQTLAGNIDEAICFNDAEIELVDARAALMRIKRAQQDQAKAIINLRGLKSYALGIYNEGRAAVEMERRRIERSLPSQFVVSEAAELFSQRMAYAQRMTYLAVRAAEYDFQTSLRARGQVLAATRPDQLEAALQTAIQFVATGRINGAAPDELHAVVSLREHLLQLGNRAGDPAGELALGDIDRFRLMLASPQYAVRDADGTYLGQQIPFAIHPLGHLGLGNAQGLPILGDNDCAERLWSVNAAVVGAGVFEGNEASFTRLDLLKSNTFYSQLCDAPAPDGPEFQIASVRPAVNLLQDPADPLRQPPTADATQAYSRGRMQPYLNVSRVELEREDYAQGGTTELAGRGLFGDYALFIPASVLSLDGSPGLRLDRIEDILLRLDYVSVARN